MVKMIDMHPQAQAMLVAAHGAGAKAFKNESRLPQALINF
jgi:hypothetical protein